MKREDQWTYKELDLLRTNYTKMTNQELAQMLNRTVSAVNMKAYLLGLKKGALRNEMDTSDDKDTD